MLHARYASTAKPCVTLGIWARTRWSVSPGWGVGLLGVALLSASCTRSQQQTPAGDVASSGPAVSGGVAPLAPELASRVLAKVGERTITLGDYAQALERMDRFERLRYQTPERRKLLLEEMIDTELLAREAERRGLDREPATQAALNQLMREEVLTELRRGQPALEELPAAEVQAYYAAHPDEFSDPERRRVSVIALRSREPALKLATELAHGSAQQWGEAVREHSVLAQGKPGTPEQARPPLELAGDLGLVSAPGAARGANAEVPDAVRVRVFELKSVGDVASEPVADGGLFYVVRLVGVSAARTRTLSEADTMIRARLLSERLRRAEAELEQRLRTEYPIEINEEAVQKLQIALAQKPASAAPPQGLP